MPQVLAVPVEEPSAIAGKTDAGHAEAGVRAAASSVKPYCVVIVLRRRLHCSTDRGIPAGPQYSTSFTRRRTSW